MTDALNMRRRLERHRQQRRMDVAANIRDTVERSQDNAKRLFFGGSDDDDDETSSANLGNAKAADPSSAAGDSDSSTGRNRASATGASSTANGASTASPTSTFSSIISSLLDPETSSSRTSSSSSSTSSSSSSTSLTPTSTSSSTLETPSSTRTRPTRTAETTAAPSSTSVVAVTNPNSLATSIQLITSSAAPIASASSTSSHSSSSVGAGPIIGIVAAALAGVVIIAAAIGFLVKKYSKKSDPYDTNPFDADQFRRQSVMLPEGFGSDDGHEPSMTEHRNYGPGFGAGAGGSMNHGYDEMSYAGASASVLGGGAGYASSYSHNDGGGPRPPTMFARHNDIHAAGMPTVGAALNTAPVPKLPAMAFGGGDPYSLAGVAGGMHNVSNPYAHLDRHGDAYHQYNNGAAPAAGLDRNGSDGSHRSQQQQQRNYGAPQSEAHETSGRPTSMEQGRSGTPDLPNVQQTYNLGSTTDDDGLEYREYMQHDGANNNNGRQSAGMNSLLDSYNSHAAGSTSPREQQRDYFFENPHSEGAAPGASSPPPPASLQVRNLTGNGQLHPAGHGQAGQRPISSVSSMQDDDAAYGGVY